MTFVRIAAAIAVALASQTTMAIPASGHAVMISGPSPYAVEVGKDIARRGGNAVDIAVAAALSMAITHPYYAALGGGGFALVMTKSGGVEALDFRETAPRATGPDFYKGRSGKASMDGPFSIAVPGIPAGLFELHRKRGKLHWSQLFPRVVDLAVKGFEVSGEWVAETKEESALFNAAAKKFLMAKNGAMLKPGDLLKQPQLGKLLKEMSARGTAPFYQGLAAHDIVDTVKNAGGVLTLEDLRAYKPRWLAPLKTEYRGYELWSMPPPSSGGVVTQAALKIMDLIGAADAKPLSIGEFHRIGEALKLAFRGRSALGDPDFAKNPTAELLDPNHLADEAKRFRDDKSIAVDALMSMAPEKSQTTHLSVMTADGEGVAMTVTLNGGYGSGIVTDKFGVALNDEMDDFATRPGEPNMFGLIQGKANAVEPGKRPLSSMSPTLATKDGKLQASVGSPGGPRIISTVTQILFRLIARKADADAAIQAPRVHDQFLPDVLYVDANRFAPETLEGLRARGHVVEESWMGKGYVVRRADDGILEGAYDSRGEGAAGGF